MWDCVGNGRGYITPPTPKERVPKINAILSDNLTKIEHYIPNLGHTKKFNQIFRVSFEGKTTRLEWTIG